MQKEYLYLYKGKILKIKGDILIYEYISQILRSPVCGYGRFFNPCIDCHGFMVRKSFGLLKDFGAKFVFTGEVLGQRPMSQNKGSLNLVATESGLNRLPMRPLSAKLLAPTIPEEKGWVQRDRLLVFQGRSRKPQMEMAQRQVW
jgi:hypothetical protein